MGTDIDDHFDDLHLVCLDRGVLDTVVQGVSCALRRVGDHLQTVRDAGCLRFAVYGLPRRERLGIGSGAYSSRWKNYNNLLVFTI